MRVKKSLGSNSQVAHVWAQQVQESGYTKNFYFENYTDLYSYGSHYLAARIHTVNGEKVALIRSDSYSSSTSKHLSDARKAVDGLMPYFNVPDVRTFDSLENFNHFNDQVIDRIEAIFKTVTVKNERGIEWKFEWLNETLKIANEYFSLAGYPTLEVPRLLLDLCREHLKSCLERYKELNTPEMIAKREQEREKREARLAEKEREKLKDRIDAWKNGEGYGLQGLHYKGHSLLRVKNNEVQTTGGASVPLSHALRLLTLIEKREARSGERIGHFTLNDIENVKFVEDGKMPVEDKIIRIGCHTILLSEAQNVLAPYRNQELKVAE